MGRTPGKFFEAVKLNARDQTSIRIVAQMDELFTIDEKARKENLNPSGRHLLRLEEAKPLLEQIKTAIQLARGDALPKSALVYRLTNNGDVVAFKMGRRQGARRAHI